MLTNQEIQDLIISPKNIVERYPVKGYDQKNGQERCDLTLTCESEEMTNFKVFIRKNNEFTENFSIGLCYKTGTKTMGSVTLIRYNGPHGETSHHVDGHYNQPHIHRITADEMYSGSLEPQEKSRKITDRYSTLEEAIMIFFGDVGVKNWVEYFPELRQRSMINGH